MAKITPKEIEHLANLARLGLSEEEKKNIAPDLDRILDYVSQLREANTKDVEPLTGGTDLLNIARNDKEADGSAIPPDVLLSQAPESEENYFKTPRILE